MDKVVDEALMTMPPILDSRNNTNVKILSYKGNNQGRKGPVISLDKYGHMNEDITIEDRTKPLGIGTLAAASPKNSSNPMILSTNLF